MPSVTSLVRGIEAHALEQIRRAEPVPVLVLSDRYPPDSVGGAEISLHEVLRRLVKAVQFTVVTFTAAADKIGWEAVDGVRVLRLPRAAGWPLQAWPAAIADAVDDWSFVAKAGATVSGVAAGLLRPAAGRDGRLTGLATWLTGPASELTMEHLGHPGAWHLGLVRQAIESLRPRVIHADNLYAILAAAECGLGRGARLIGQVRDNRFLCPRRDQDARINGKPCDGCTVGCIAAETAGARGIVGTMARTRDYRRAQLRKLDRIVVASRYLERQVGSIAADIPLTRITNPVDDPDDVASWVDSAPRLPGSPVAVVGTLREGKGQAVLLRKMPEMQRTVPDIHLHIAGRGPDEAALRRLADETGITGKVTFHGNLARPDLYRLLSGCRVIAVPSLWPEPFGRIPLEAAMVERPVVAFAVGGLCETIQDEATGLLAPPGDAESLAAAIVRLLRTPELCIKLTATAKRRVLGDHHPDEVAGQVFSLWHEELGRGEDQQFKLQTSPPIG
jgi:glycosyltransferase involved in cell wall biosynthesis